MPGKAARLNLAKVRAHLMRRAATWPEGPTRELVLNFPETDDGHEFLAYLQAIVELDEAEHRISGRSRSALGVLA